MCRCSKKKNWLTGTEEGHDSNENCSQVRYVELYQVSHRQEILKRGWKTGKEVINEGISFALFSFFHCVHISISMHQFNSIQFNLDLDLDLDYSLPLGMFHAVPRLNATSPLMHRTNGEEPLLAEE